MKYAIIKVSLATIIGVVTPRIAVAQTAPTSVIQDIKIKSYEILGKDTVTASFAPGSSDLQQSDRQNMAAVVAAMRNSSVIGSAIVAGWADHEYPASKGQQLGKAERELANARIGKVKNALYDLGVKPVDAHSMAEKPTWLGSLFNSEDTKLKGAGKVRNEEDELTTAIGKIIRENGGPGKVVVIIRRQGDKTAH